MDWWKKLWKPKQPPRIPAEGLEMPHALRDAIRCGELRRIKRLLKDRPELVFSRYWEIGGWKFCPDEMRRGLTPVHIAVEENQKKVLKLLLARRAEANAKGFIGQTPLHRAAANCHEHIAKMLLAHGASVNAEDDNGWTPLRYAARLQDGQEVARLLRQHGGKLDF